MSYSKQEVETKGALRAAKNRIRGLLDYSILCTTTIEDLLASAYLQGVRDAAELQNEEYKNEMHQMR